MRFASSLLALALFGGSAFVLAGCPGNQCFLKICEGANCRCSISSCGEGAAFDVRQNRCRCLLGHFSVAGQCLTQQQANAFCGPGRHWEQTGCVQDHCRPGDELDASTGFCIPHDKVNQVATSMGVPVGQGQQLGCPPGQKLVVDGNVAACVPLSQTCARDETWNGTACVKVGTCATGATWDPNRAQCVQYAQGSSSSELAVNVADWATANYGPNGGAGTPAFCGAFSNKPYSFGISDGNAAVVRVTINMSFPGSEISKGVAQSIAAFDLSGNPVPARGAQDVQSSAQALFSTLVLGGGRASMQTASTTVKCTIANAAKPRPVPATGGL